MKRFLIIVCIICLFSLRLVSSPFAGQPTEFPDGVTLTTVDGKALDSAALKSRPLVLIIGATWCPECRREAPEVEKAYRQYEDRSVMFLWVLGGSKDEDIKDFLLTYKITYPVARDNGIAEALGVRVIPQTLFFATGGKFVKKIIGPASQKELTENIEKIIGK